MNATTLDFDDFQQRCKVVGSVSVRVPAPQKACKVSKLNKEAQRDARALELLAIFEERDHTPVSGAFGSFLF